MNNLFKKMVFITILILISSLLISCGVTGGRELNSLAIVVATGLDIEGDKIIITNEVINPVAGGTSRNSSAQEGTIFVQGIGNTISDAIANTTLTFDRELYYPFSYIIIFGDDFARSGIGAYLDTLSRGNEQRESGYLLVAKEGKAYDLMGINSGLAQSPGKYIYDLISNEIFNDETRTLTINEFFRYFYRPHEGHIMGSLSSVEKKQINKQVSQSTFDVLCVEGGAAFKDDKLIGYYTGEEMIGFNFIVNELHKALIVFESPDYLVDKEKIIAGTDKFSALKIYKSRTKLDIELIDDKLHLFIDVKFRGSLSEINQGLDISQPGVLSEMEKACAEKVKYHIDSSLKKGMKEFKVDTFSIGELVHRKHPKLWRKIKDDWAEIFSELEYTINVTASINDTGFTNTPPNIRKGK